jgi:hypothetical protein
MHKQSHVHDLLSLKIPTATNVRQNYVQFLSMCLWTFRLTILMFTYIFLYLQLPFKITEKVGLKAIFGILFRG